MAKQSGLPITKQNSIKNSRNNNIKSNRSRKRQVFLRNLKEKTIKGILFIAAIFSVLIVFFILFFLLYNGYLLFEEVSLAEFIFGDKWNPSPTRDVIEPSYGAKPLIIATFLVMAGAMMIAIPLGILTAIYISQFSPPRIRESLKLFIEILSGIPSVVFGLFGLLILTEWLAVNFNEPHGETWLAGSILLGVMALPTIITVAEDAITAVPFDMKEASLGLGATRWQTTSRVVVPAAMSGITAAVILGMGRAIGETMVVMMVCGNAPVIPEPMYDVFSPVMTITGALGIEMGEAPIGSNHQYALFALGVVLFVIILVINSISIYLLNRLKEKHYGLAKGKKSSHFFTKIKSYISIPPFIRKLMRRVVQLIFIAIILWVLVIWFDIVYGLAALGILGILYYIMKKSSVKTQQRFAVSILLTSTLIVIGMITIILYYIVTNGIEILSWNFISEYPAWEVREYTRDGQTYRQSYFVGGIYPHILGTLYLVLGAIGFALPIGICAGIYISEYAKESKLLKVVRAGIDNLNGTPSIVFGLFGYAFLVVYIGFGRSLIAGQITLGLMILPTIIRTTEEALKAVPQSLREGSLALGATKWQTIRRVVLPPASSGVITGSILSIGRAGGETAPILFTAAAITTFAPPSSVFDSVGALPYAVFEYSYNSTFVNHSEVASGAALILLLIVLTLYGSAAVLRNRFRKKVRW